MIPLALGEPLGKLVVKACVRIFEDIEVDSAMFNPAHDQVKGYQP